MEDPIENGTYRSGSHQLYGRQPKFAASEVRLPKRLQDGNSAIESAQRLRRKNLNVVSKAQTGADDPIKNINLKIPTSY